mmetsp:Transcript_29546/g.54215  ORF Transcript_29546/g.54215 Transcript_29546/m.54215 type:complete len:128 (-) Transcript_29546:192-575(-)
MIMTSMLDPRAYQMVLELIRDWESNRRSINNSNNNNSDSSSKSERLGKYDSHRIPSIIFQESTNMHVNDAQQQQQQPCCAICTDDFIAGERVMMLPPCRHLFHKKCIVPWLTQCKGCCPLCMSNVEL